MTVKTHELFSLGQWQHWIDQVNNCTLISWKKTTKSAQKIIVNLKERLFSLSLESHNADNSVMLRYLGSCRNDGIVLKPKQVIYLLEQISKQELRELGLKRRSLDGTLLSLLSWCC